MTQVVVSATLPSVRHGLSAMLAEHGHEIIPDTDPAAERAVWLLDAPDQARLDALLAHRYSDSPRAAVVLTDEPTLTAQLAQSGLRGWACLGRDAGPDDLDLAVRAADGGLVLVDLPTAAASIPTAAAAPLGAPRRAPAEPLTPRELQVLQLVAQGTPNKGIARALGISENTAKFHVASLIAKLGASGRTEAVTLAARQGLILL